MKVESLLLLKIDNYLVIKDGLNIPLNLIRL